MKMLKVFPKLALCVLLTSSTAVFAASKNNQQLTDELAALQKGVDQMQQDMQGLRKLLDNRAMLELFQRMDELSEEASQLRGMLEQQNHDLAGIKKRQRELYLDIDRRLRELEITSRGAPAPAAQAPASSETNVTAPIAPAVPAVSAPAAQSTVSPSAAENNAIVQPGATRPATINGAPRPENVPVSEERAEYQKAFDMLKEGRYKMANAAFKDFIDRYPQGSYAGNAQYWLGESNYVTRQFEQALTEFSAVLSKYPQSNKVPDAMLKLGYTYYELARFDEARQVLQKLIKLDPKSTAARLAGKRLERMSREGR
jgi:tol-pal system protein YbgF